MKVSGEALTTFAVVAEEYCGFIDSLRGGRPRDFYKRLEGLLERIHGAILQVKSGISHGKLVDAGNLNMGEVEFRELWKLLDDMTASETLQLFEWHESLRNKNETGVDYCAARATMFHDDLASIYKDLRDGLAIWRIGTEDSHVRAAWKWRDSYEFHWGDHLMSAMTTAHEARCKLHAE